MNIPEKLTNFRVYENGNTAYGVATVTLPKLEAITETISGAGISGEVESPVVGHFKAMKLELEFSNPGSVFYALAVGDSTNLQIRGSLEVYGNGQRKDVPLKVSIMGRVLSSEGGKLEVGKKISPKAEISAEYYKVELDGQTVIEIDVYNFIAIINGKNLLAKVAENLGINGGGNAAGNSIRAALNKIGI